MRDLLARNRVLKNSGIADTRSNTPPGAEIEHLRKSQAPLSSHPKLRSRPCWRGHSYVSLIDRQVTVMAFQKVPPGTSCEFMLKDAGESCKRESVPEGSARINCWPLGAAGTEGTRC